MFAYLGAATETKINKLGVKLYAFNRPYESMLSACLIGKEF